MRTAIDDSPAACGTLVAAVDKVANQVHRRIGAASSVSKEDIKQDLFREAFSDTQFLAALYSCADERGTLEVAYAFLDKTRKRLCREYRAKWPRLGQLTFSQDRN
jgi:hypothetical protein